MAIEERACKVCGRKFVGTSRAKYCGGNCKQAAYYARKKEVNQGREDNKGGSKR